MMLKKVKIALNGSYMVENKNYKLHSKNHSFELYEKGKQVSFLELGKCRIELFHMKNILYRFGFELVNYRMVIKSNKDFLDFFAKYRIGILLSPEGEYLFINRLGQFHTKEFLEEKYNVMIIL